jgi:hypothetical protein
MMLGGVFAFIGRWRFYLRTWVGVTDSPKNGSFAMETVGGRSHYLVLEVVDPKEAVHGQ